MPELPEVTVIVNSLNKKIKGLVLRSIEYDWPKKFYWGDFSIDDLRGAEVSGVERRGKIVVINLETSARGPVTSFPPASARSRLKSNGTQKDNVELRAVGNPSTGATPGTNLIAILIHLKLTGQLIYQDKKTRIAGGHPLPPLNKPVPNSTTRVTITFDRGKLYFNDMRKFGWVKIIEDKKLEEEDYIKKLGPDPLKMKFDEFRERLKAKRQGRIKKTLMDQSVVGGIGNIYSDEGLWRAKVHPKRSIISLNEAEMKAIYNGVRESFKIAIEKGGSSANAYVDSGGEKGLYLSFGKAYHMTGKPCARCKTPIVQEKMDGRSAHFCPNCQRLK